jgi:hypothetical protein
LALSGDYRCLRVDEFDTVLLESDFPEVDAAALAVTPGSGTAATFDWDVPPGDPDPDGWIIGAGKWWAPTWSRTVAGNVKSATIAVKAVPEVLFARPFNEPETGLRVYSEAIPKIETTPAVPSGYVVPGFDWPELNSEWPDGTGQNALSIPTGQGEVGNALLLQIVPSVDLTWRSPILDAGADAPCFLSLRTMATLWAENPAESQAMSDPFSGFGGVIAGEFATWSVTLDYGSAPDLAGSSQLEIGPLLGSDLVVSGRYFRITFRGRPPAIPAGGLDLRFALFGIRFSAWRQ